MKQFSFEVLLETESLDCGNASQLYVRDCS